MSEAVDAGRQAPRICAVVVTYRRPIEVAACAEALLRVPQISSIIVVDNGHSGTDRLRALSRTAVIESRENIGPSGGFRIGIDAALDAGADWVYLLNDDDRPTDGALACLLNELSTHADPDSIGGISGWVRSSTAIRPLGERRVHGRFCIDGHRADATDTYEVDACVFSGLLVRCSAIRAVGNVRGDLFMMGEEHEFCTRLRLGGYRILVTPKPLVDLQLHEEGGVNPPWRGYYGARNSVHLLRSIPDRRLVDWARLLGRQAKFAAAALRLDRPVSRVRYRLLGLLHGLGGVTGRTVEPS